MSTTDPLTIALVAAGSSLLTIFLTPWLQHRLWRRQKRDEIRLATIKEFNGLTSQFITDYLYGTKPGADWFKAFNVVGGEIAALFSPEALEALKAVDQLIGPGQPGLGPQGNKTTDDFIRARDAALRVLYREVGLL